MIEDAITNYYRLLDHQLISITPQSVSLQVHMTMLLFCALCYPVQEHIMQAMKDYPDTCAVLVRRHGVYVWGDTWQKTKAMLVQIMQHVHARLLFRYCNDIDLIIIMTHVHMHAYIHTMHTLLT